MKEGEGGREVVNRPIKTILTYEGRETYVKVREGRGERGEGRGERGEGRGEREGEVGEIRKSLPDGRLSMNGLKFPEILR